MNFLPANRLRLYRDFKALDSNDFHGIVRYFEQHEDGIRALDFDECFECTLAYTNALYATGQHGKHLVMCSHLLEIIIMHNIESRGGENLYERMLHRKASSHYQLHELEQAEHVWRELIKIDPADRIARRFLEKCLLQQTPGWLMKTRAAGVALSLLAAIVIAVELLIVKSFFEDWLFAFQIGHNVVLGVGVGFFAIGESWHAWRCRRSVLRFADRVKRRKITT